MLPSGRGPLPSGGRGSSSRGEPPASDAGPALPSSSPPGATDGAAPEGVAEGEPLPAGASQEEGASQEAGDSEDAGVPGEGAKDEAAEEEPGEEEEGGSASGGPSTTGRPRAALPAGEGRKAISRFFLFFLGFMGLLMILDTNTRNTVALELGLLLGPAVGFDGQHLLLTMFLVAALEMGFSALAYHFTTDWIETARVQKHQQAIRPLWTQAMRSGKKDRMEALKPHMDTLNVRQSRVTINQLKGMVITWVLLIAMYTWMGIFIASQCPGASIGALPAATYVNAPVQVNGSASGGHPGYVYGWWASGAASVNGPEGPGATRWNFTPTVQGTYKLTLQVTDARGDAAVVTSSSLQVVGPSGIAVVPHAPPALPTGTSSTTGPAPAVTSPGCTGSSVNFFGAETNLLSTALFPIWFFAFSLYTVPLNLIFRRYLKHAALARELTRIDDGGPPPEGAAPPATAGALP